jgi:DNA-binding CsgD family transcriptional regulator
LTFSLKTGESASNISDADLSSRFMEATDAWPLTGRAEELSVLIRLLDGSDEGTGVVIAGRAGVGKTRLAREAAAAATGLGWVVRSVVGTAAAQSIPLGAFVEWAGGLDGNPLQIVRGVIAAITSGAQGKPVLVAVDDAHLLDDLSAFVLYRLVLGQTATVIATLRSGEPAPDAVTALWKDAQLRRLDLQPLSRSQSDALLATVLGGRVDTPCAEQVWRLTWGNVLFLRHLVTQELEARRLVAGTDGWQWTGAMAVSESLTDLIDAQIGGVADAVGDVIDLVAIAEPLELDYLRRLTEPDAIECCERRGLITLSPTPQGQVTRVGHPLYGEVRRAQAGRVRLARLCGRLASVMTRSDAAAGRADPVRLGGLWLDSDLPPDPGVFLQAAQGARARLDIDLASRFAEAAVAAGAGVEAQLLLAHTLSLTTSPEQAQEMLDGLAASPLPDPLRSVVGQLRASNLLWPLARPEEAWAVIDESLVGASPTATAEALAFRALQLATAGRPAEALTTSASIDAALLAGYPALILAWAQTIALGDLGHPQQAATVAEEGVTTAAAVSPEAAMQTPSVVLCQVQALILGGDVARAQAIAEHGYRRWTDVPGASRTFAAAMSGMAIVAAGDVPTALQRLRSAVADAERVCMRTGAAYFFMIIYLETVCYTGDPDAITEALDLVERSRHPAMTFLEPAAQLATAWVSAASGRLAEARRRAEAAAACAHANGQHAWEVRCRQAAIQFGDTGQARRLAELATQVEGQRVWLVAGWADAIARRDGETLSTVSSDLEAIGDRIAAADAAAHAAVAFRRNQQRGAALTASARASRLISECGATTPATRAAATPLPLTNRERETAELVAHDLSNKQIAESLTLSVRTVEGHILKCCNKLGLANRTELAQFMYQVAHHKDNGLARSRKPSVTSGPPH